MLLLWLQATKPNPKFHRRAMFTNEINSGAVPCSSTDWSSTRASRLEPSALRHIVDVTPSFDMQKGSDDEGSK